MSVETVPFVSGCPVTGCSYANAELYWKHHNCGASETINGYGDVNCNNGHNLGIFVKLYYNCGYGHHNFEKGDWDNFNTAISILFKLRKVSRDFKTRLRDIIDQEYNL